MPAKVQLNAWVMEDIRATKTQKSSVAKHLPTTQTQSRFLRELQSISTSLRLRSMDGMVGYLECC